MRKKLVKLTILGGLISLLGACDFASSRMFDNNCSGNASVQNPNYCSDTFHPNAGPFTGNTEK